MSKSKKDEFVKNQIIEASKKVFQEYGYKKTNMMLIAAASDKGRSTLYYYFKNKDDVLEALMLSLIKPLIESLSVRLTKRNTIEKNLRIYSEEHLKRINILKNTFEVFLKELKVGFDFTRKIMVRIRGEVVSHIEDCIKWAIGNLEITPLDNDDIKFLALAIVTSNENLVQEYYIYETIQGDITSRIKWINQLIIKSLKIN
ncbi:TetR/AcrR family transcriptional regulator [Cellulophaga baltica]|uniref:TetR/AcrR family transcriptional regulator n=1 Tax=Cellulophaga TaxID=104264 RepID=UPI001C06805A|nr:MULTISPECIES: TetR/AcrR family transcriptional regulator [Cellulophaga]MBU2996789.1 TetR/AcrR family transcriptional regulator [Cellulophaga baltica]MDO6768185.1 TetR/AcrR family transcriptional regulator [Cellulophaga sp. 1_MG-2023]